MHQHSYGTLIALLIILVVIIVFKLIGRAMCCYDDEVETVTTTTIRDQPEQPNIVGNLKRQIEGVQGFVVDPVDGQKTWLNSNDDMYEDADGKIWRLV